MSPFLVLKLYPTPVVNIEFPLATPGSVSPSAGGFAATVHFLVL